MKNTIKVLPSAGRKTTKTKPKRTRVRSNSIDYYGCLVAQAQNNWVSPFTGEKQKITTCCRECKHNAPVIAGKRKKALQDWMVNYQQLGRDFVKLIATDE